MWSNKLLVKFYQLFWHTHQPSIAQQIFTQQVAVSRISWLTQFCPLNQSYLYLTHYCHHSCTEVSLLSEDFLSEESVANSNISTHSISVEVSLDLVSYQLLTQFSVVDQSLGEWCEDDLLQDTHNIWSVRLVNLCTPAQPVSALYHGIQNKRVKFLWCTLTIPYPRTLSVFLNFADD